MMKVTIYTDGACKGNPGPGGWAAWLSCKDQEKTLSGAELNTTNNRMELMAALKALEALKRPCEVDLYTDSQYLRTGMSSWLAKWKANGWRTAKKAPIKNQDLWELLDKFTTYHQVQWHWVKGHSGHPLNELVDELANQAISQLLNA